MPNPEKSTYHSSVPNDSLQGTIVTISGLQYRVSRALKQHGDDPSLTSWLLVPLPEYTNVDGDAPSSRVIKTLATIGGLDELIRATQTEVLRLDGIRSVPRYFVEDRLDPQDSQGGKCMLPLKVVGKDGAEITVIVVREYVDGKLLSQWMVDYEAAQDVPQAVFSGIRDAATWFRLAERLVEAMKPIHNERLIHGDLRPRRIALRGMMDTEERCATDIEGADIVYLDPEGNIPPVYPANGIAGSGTFRRKYDSPLRLFEKKEHAEVLTAASRNRAQYFALTDIFSLGIILFELAYGTGAKLSPFLEASRAPSDGGNADGPEWYKVPAYQARLSNRQLKNALFDAWKARLKDLRQTRDGKEVDAWQLESGKERLQFICMREVILACLRTGDPSACNLDGISNTINLFNVLNFEGPDAEEPDGIGTKCDSEAMIAAREQCERTITKAVDDYLTACRGLIPTALSKVMRKQSKDWSRVLTQVTDAAFGFLRIEGREEIVRTIVSLLNGLREDQSFEALLTPGFFNSGNIGRHGRVLSALQLAALRGRKVQWVLVVNEEELYTKDVMEILEAHYRGWKDIDRFLDPVTPPGGELGKAEAARRGVYGIFYKIVNKPTYEEVFQRQSTSLVIGPRSGAYESLVDCSAMLIAPDYHGEEPTINAMRLWPSIAVSGDRLDSRRAQLRDAFTEACKNKLHIRTFYR